MRVHVPQFQGFGAAAVMPLSLTLLVGSVQDRFRPLAIGIWGGITGWAPSRKDYPVQGLYVSAADGELAWPTLATMGADFAYVRASAGGSQRDARFAAAKQALATPRPSGCHARRGSHRLCRRG